MAERKRKAKAKPKGKRKTTPPRKSHPRKVPLILQTRRVKTGDDGEVKEVTVGELICLAVRSGAYRTEAARAAGIGRTVIYNWARKGEDAIALAQEHVEDGEQVTPDDVPEADVPYVDFVNALEEAEAEAEIWHVRNVKEHARKDFRASTWWLARRHPERWGPREHPDSGSSGTTLYDFERLMAEAEEA